MRFQKNSGCRACGGSSIQHNYGNRKKTFTLTSGITKKGTNTMILNKNTSSIITQNNNVLIRSNLYNFSTNSNKRIHMVIR